MIKLSLKGQPDKLERGGVGVDWGGMRTTNEITWELI